MYFMAMNWFSLLLFPRLSPLGTNEYIELYGLFDVVPGNILSFFYVEHCSITKVQWAY